MKKRRAYILLSLILIASLLVVEPVGATTISDIKKKQQEAQKELDAANENLSGLQGNQDALEEEIGEIDSSLVEIMASISLLEEDIQTKKDEIVIAQAEYDKAKASAEAQYEAMKKRIKFMYEKGDTAYIELFLEAKSITDMLNKADYVELLYAYDRKLLGTYQDTQRQVAEFKEALENEKSELEATQFEYEEEKVSLQAVLNEKKAESSNYEAMINQAQLEAEAYKTMIKQQNAQIKQIEQEEARKAAEEAKKNAPKNGETNNSKPEGNGNTSYAAVIEGANGSSKGKEIASYGCQFIGNPYVAGGTSLTGGADCSGFTYSVYKAFGYKLTRNSTDQRSEGVGVDYANAQPGDLICYAGHVGIYIGGNKIVHASSVRTGIKVTTATYRPILAVRRVVS